MRHAPVRLAMAASILVLLGSAVPLFSGARLRVAAFRCDVTPDLGQPLIWTTPAARVADPLWAKGVVLENGRERFVLCALDWCGIGGETYRVFRGKIAAAAGTDARRVELHSVHQHTAPYIDGDAYRILATRPNPPLMMSPAFLDKVTDGLAAAVKDACSRLTDFDQIGTGKSIVSQVASARRILGPRGDIVTRWSTGGQDPAMAALPEGSVDPELRTVTLAAHGKPLVRLHYYATHPQTFCCEGTVTGDFVAAARESVEREEKIPQIYFTGCAGDVTVGKYNDGTAEARSGLGDRLEAGMKSAIANTTLAPAGAMNWRTLELRLPVNTGALESLRERLSGTTSADEMYRTAITLAFAQRRDPLSTSVLRIGPVRILNLPGEPMLDFQLYARTFAPGDFVVVAGYGDISPGYLCTDRAFVEGGYEPGASNARAGTEAAVKQSIRKLMK